MSFLTTTGARVNDGYKLLYRARLPDCAICLGIPVACSPQAWAAGTPLLLLQSSLGLEFDPDRNEILLRNPRLPQFLEEVALRNLRLGQSVVDLMLRRHDNDVSLQVLRNEGQIMVAAVYS